MAIIDNFLASQDLSMETITPEDPAYFEIRNFGTGMLPLTIYSVQVYTSGHTAYRQTVAQVFFNKLDNTSGRFCVLVSLDSDLSGPSVRFTQEPGGDTEENTLGFTPAYLNPEVRREVLRAMSRQLSPTSPSIVVRHRPQDATET